MNNTDKCLEIIKMAIDCVRIEISVQFANWCKLKKVKQTRESYNDFMRDDSIDMKMASQIFKVNRRKRKEKS